MKDKIFLIFITVFGCCFAMFLELNIQQLTQQSTNDKFISVTLDTGLVAENFLNFNMTDKRLQKMTAALTPDYIRIGGNMADQLYFSDNLIKNDDQISECPIGTNFINFTMTGEEWMQINKFAKAVGTKILFDFNCLIRYENGSWNATNAEDLISFSDHFNYDIDWQLGNEPNAFKHMFNYEVNASQLAHDFVQLKSVLSKYKKYKRSKVVGPDTTRPLLDHPASAIYLREFLLNIDKRILNVVAFHQYYLNGRIATLPDFVNLETFKMLEDQLSLANNIINETGFAGTPVWLSETSSAYGGGAPNLSDRFVAVFLWLDKLGIAAKYGIKQVFRQSLFKNHYALIDDNYQPNPDWWLTVIYQRFVGPKVFQCALNTSSLVRLYCQSTAGDSKKSPAITVFGLNAQNETAHVKIKTNCNTSHHGIAYVLTAGGSSLTTKKVFLNGVLLELNKNGDLPLFPKKVVDVRNLIMPPYSLAFWIVPLKHLDFFYI